MTVLVKIFTFLLVFAMFGCGFGHTYARSEKNTNSSLNLKGVVDREKIATKVVFELMPHANLSQYPGLLEEISSFGKDDGFLQAKVSTIQTPKNDILYLVLLEGALTCGIHGCSIMAYKKDPMNKSISKINFYLIANLPIYRLSCNKESLYLLFSGGGGTASFAVMKYENGNFLALSILSDFSEFSCPTVKSLSLEKENSQ